MHLEAATYDHRKEAMSSEAPFIKVEHLTKIFYPAKGKSWLRRNSRSKPVSKPLTTSPLRSRKARSSSSWDYRGRANPPSSEC